MTLDYLITSDDRYYTLPFKAFEEQRHSIFVVDYTWNYLYVNSYTSERLPGITMIDRNVRDIWQEHPHIPFRPLFELLKNQVEKRQRISIQSTSPVTKKRIQISGYPLADCYCFSVSELPEKTDLLSELKNSLPK